MRTALIVLILAQLASAANVEEVRDLLRQAAVKAGCERPAVSMRWLGEDHALEIEVRCPVPEPTEGK